ncbi:hypothetical protein GF389_03720, partial [Candidatus Dojkabacteria bacterium]|nr:hypothetical protein [Candidatus Dojkabacteria bacterium]
MTIPNIHIRQPDSLDGPNDPWIPKEFPMASNFEGTVGNPIEVGEDVNTPIVVLSSGAMEFMDWYLRHAEDAESGDSVWERGLMFLGQRCIDPKTGQRWIHVNTAVPQARFDDEGMIRRSAGAKDILSSDWLSGETERENLLKIFEDLSIPDHLKPTVENLGECTVVGWQHDHGLNRFAHLSPMDVDLIKIAFSGLPIAAFVTLKEVDPILIGTFVAGNLGLQNIGGFRVLRREGAEYNPEELNKTLYSRYKPVESQDRILDSVRTAKKGHLRRNFWSVLQEMTRYVVALLDRNN